MLAKGTRPTTILSSPYRNNSSLRFTDLNHLEQINSLSSVLRPKQSLHHLHNQIQWRNFSSSRASFKDEEKGGIFSKITSTMKNIIGLGKTKEKEPQVL
jgi:hypothetical protein